jgi:hypothetical protein
MQLTASRSSRIVKSAASKKQRAKEGNLPLLPSDIGYIKSLEEGKAERAKRQKEHYAKLDATGPAKLEWELPPKFLDRIDNVIKLVLGKMWEPIPDKGLGREGRGNVFQFRASAPPLVMLTHLHGLFIHNSTLVDRSVLIATQSGKLRRLIVNLVDGGDVLITADQYYSLLEKSCSESNAGCISAFRRFLVQHPSAVMVTHDELTCAGAEPGVLLANGFLVLQNGKGNVYNMSVPNIGSYLKLVTSCRRYVCKTLSKLPWKELPEETLQSRWTSNKMYWKDFKGAKLDWVFYDCIGGGWCEAFSTPVGRGWKLTGKAL